MTSRAGVILDPGPFNENSSNIVHLRRDAEQFGSPANPMEDILEHHQAKQQSQFVEKFHILKQWQEEQKEKLLQEQQQRMEMLLNQQERLQRALAVQRSKQWGGSNSLSPFLSGLSSSSQQTQSPASPDTIMPTDSVRQSFLQRYDSHSLANLLQKAQDEILEEEDEQDEGSDIENNGLVVEEGFYPLPDTASEYSDADGPQLELEEDKTPQRDHIHHQMSPEEHNYPHGKMRSPHYNDDMLHESSPPPRQFSPEEEQKRESSVFSDEDRDFGRLEEEEAFSDKISGRGFSSVPERSQSGGDDERPIHSIFGTKSKTFEELLDEKLQKERNDETVPPRTTADDRPKFSFLKKGEGLAKFGKMKIPLPTKRVNRKELLNLKEEKGNKGLDERQNQKMGKEKQPLQSHSKTSSAQRLKEVDPGPTDPFKKPLGPAPVSVHKEKLSSRVARSNSTGNSVNPSMEELVSKKETMDKSFGQVQWEKKKELEEEDLAEFEMLEQAADDNSFSSENSLVVGVLQRAKLRSQMLASSPKRGLPTLHSVDTVDEPEAQPLDLSEAESPDKSHDDDHNQQLSDKADDESDLNETLTEERERSSSLPLTRRKVTKGQSTADVEGSRYRGISAGLGGNGISDLNVEPESSDDESDKSMDGLVTVIPNRLYKMIGSNDRDVPTEIQEKHEYPAGKYEEMEKHSEIPDFPTKVSSVESSEVSGEEEEKEGGSEERQGGGGYEFEDDETWGDFSADLSDSSSDSILQGGPTLTSTPPVATRKMGSRKSALGDANIDNSPSDGAKREQMESTPPPSHLVAKLFPQLKPKEKVAQDKPSDEHLHRATSRPVGEGLQAKVFKEKLAELEDEIERFRKENAALAKLRQEREKGLEAFKKEVTEFEKQKEAELKKIEEFRHAEMKKLRSCFNERKKIFEKHQKAVRSLPDKKDREEMEKLKEQFAELQDELSRRESRWSANSKRLHDRIEVLTNENDTLRREMEEINKQRQEEQAKEEKRKAAARTKALKEACKPKSLIPTVNPGNFKPLPSNLPSPPDQVKPTAISTEKKPRQAKSIGPSCGSDHELSDSDAEPLGDDGQHGSSSPPTRDESTLYQAQGGGLRGHKSSPQEIPEKDTESESEQIHHPDGKVEHILQNGSRVISFQNGTRKKISPDGQMITVTFFNGDTRQIFPDQRVVYYYAETQITHTTYQDGLEIIQFPNNQTEKHYPDGTKEIIFPDQTIKYLFQNGGEECVFPDGTVLRVDPSGDRTMEFPNGQREIHTAQFKKREYPDGTVKTIYPDGRQETRYAHGRIRVKDKDGRVLVDQQT